eukprot:UN32127
MPNALEIFEKTHVIYKGAKYEYKDKINVVNTGFNIRARFMEKFELDNFPFDVQDLPIILECSSQSKQIHMVPQIKKDNFLRVMPQYMALADWEVKGVVCNFLSTDPALSRGGKQYDQCIVSVKAER